ncbi:MAG: dihydrolipoamide acetyltransferase family protein [Nitrospiraceae bacterium]
MPALGMVQETGRLVNWLKAEGEPVAKGEPLMEVETDKATVEIEAPASGILSNVGAAVGDEVPVGQTVAVILAPGESPPRHPSPVSTPPPHREISPQQSPSATTHPRSEARRTLASPAARRMAKEKGIDLAGLKGTGAEGVIVAQDVLSAAGTPTGPSGTQPGVREVLPLSAMRRIIGERMSRSKQSAPHFYISMDVDMTQENKRRAEWKKKGEEVIPSINDVILWSCAQALRDAPLLNSAFTEQGVKVFSDINISFALAVSDGLVAPVIRNADRLGLTDLAQRSRELSEKAQKKRLLPLDYEGGTFTVSNLGMLGVDSFVAIINPPQCAILAVGQVSPRVVARGEGIVVRSMMTMTLSADHRIVDGVVAARFLKQVKEVLEGPGS